MFAQNSNDTPRTNPTRQQLRDIARTGNYQTLQQFFQTHAHNRRQYKQTDLNLALISVVKAKKFDMVLLLLSQGARVTWKNMRDQCAMNSLTFSSPPTQAELRCLRSLELFEALEKFACELSVSPKYKNPRPGFFQHSKTLTRINYPLDIDHRATRIINLLEQKHLMITGGYIRDRLLGATPHDLDLACDLSQQRVQEMLEQAGIRYQVKGKRDGYQSLFINIGGLHIDISFTQSFAPDVKHDTAYQYAFSKDYTVNMMMYDLESHTIIDPFAGMKHLALGELTTIPYPLFDNNKLKTDPIKLLRAIRLQLTRPIQLSARLEELLKTTPAEIFYRVESHKLREELLKIALPSPDYQGGSEQDIRFAISQIKISYPGIAQVLTNRLEGICSARSMEESAPYNNVTIFDDLANWPALS